MKEIIPESYFSGRNRKPGPCQWKKKEEGVSEREFEGQYNGTLRPIECGV